MGTPRSHARPRLASASDWTDTETSLVVLDLASVETFLLVGLLSRTVSEPGGALWCPLQSGPAVLDRDRGAAQSRAVDLDLSVAWPVDHWRPVPRAMRVAALAMAHGCAEPYMRSMSRIAFAAGMDINKVTAPIGPGRSHLADPELYYVAAGEELGLNPREVTRATQDGSDCDRHLQALATRLADLGITQAPAVRLRGELYVGEQAISRTLAVLDARYGAC